MGTEDQKQGLTGPTLISLGQQLKGLPAAGNAEIKAVLGSITFDED